jgi:hypothetical protein
MDVLEIGTHFLPRSAWTVILLVYICPRRDERHTPLHTQPFLIEMGSCKIFFLGWTRTMILLISAFQVAMITGISHQHLLQLLFVLGIYILVFSGLRCSSVVEHAISWA